MEDANARLRGWQEDAELLLSFLEGFVRERQVVFCKFAAPYKQTLLRPVPTARCKNGRGPQHRTRGRRHNEVAREEQGRGSSVRAKSSYRSAAFRLESHGFRC